MSKLGTKSLQEIEEITREYISKEFDAPKESIIIPKSVLEEIAGQPIYNVSGYSKWEWGGLLGIRQRLAIRRFEVQIEAWTGNIVGKKLFELERMK